MIYNKNIKLIIVYFVGLLIYSFGACLMTIANIGISPITSVAFVMSEIFSRSLGLTMFMMNVILILIQIIILGKSFDKKQFIQIPLSIVFSLFVDLSMYVAINFESNIILVRCIIFSLSLIIMASGISLLIVTNLFMLPGDAVAQAIGIKSNFEFGKAKVITDCGMVIVSIALGVIFSGEIIGIQIGTIITALLLGNFARFIVNKVKMPVLTFIRDDEKVVDFEVDELA